MSTPRQMVLDAAVLRGAEPPGLRRLPPMGGVMPGVVYDVPSDQLVTFLYQQEVLMARHKWEKHRRPYVERMALIRSILRARRGE